jgi:alkanesulfonate monooxygenase SsuD/methylene tetrahydromethanopterin reductase-like flavin-dependent oxidoreductase (luciferase family)
MLRNEKVSLDGKRYQVTDAINSPAPLSKVPIMIGGSGEKKTLRMVAQYADESNLVGVTAADIPRKLAALDEHCERIGRDRSEIDVTCLQMVVVAPTMEEAEADIREIAAVKGWNDEIIEIVKSMVVFGDTDTVGERLQAVMDAGLDGLTVDLPVNGHIPDRIALLGEIGLAATAK